jgi:hypothetical protein
LAQHQSAQIKVRDLRATVGRDRATVSFIQDYDSPRQHSITTKTMIWRFEAGQWKIVREEAKIRD